MKNTKLKNKILDFVEANEMDNEGKKWGLPLIPDFPVSLWKLDPNHLQLSHFRLPKEFRWASFFCRGWSVAQ